jgi:hypothetical protein
LKTPMSDARAMVDRMTARLRDFGTDVKHFTALAEQDVPDIAFGAPGKIRWWRWNGLPYGKTGWDVLRTTDGHWLGWSVGKVAHPPFFAQVFPRSRGTIIASIDGFGGFVLPPQLPQALVFEKALCAAPGGAR